MRVLYYLLFEDGHEFLTREAKSAVEAIDRAYEDQVPYDVLLRTMLKFYEKDGKVYRRNLVLH